VYKVLVGKPEGNRPPRRPRRRWEDGIRIDLREIGLGGVDWIRLAQDRDRWRAVVSAVMNLRVSYLVISFIGPAISVCSAMKVTHNSNIFRRDRTEK
jgi:hypothetical protein